MKLYIKYPAIFLLLLLGSNVMAGQVQMSKKWHTLNRLLDEEEKTIRTRITKMGPRLRWRLIELDTERIKLIREKENKIFLNASAKDRKKRKKDSYFTESKRLYTKVRKEGLKILKIWPRFKYASEIYYTLALNSRDYGGDKETEKFLLLSLKHSIPNSPIIHSAKTSLAEYYYNNKKYKRAIRYYTDVLKNKDDEWYTKHLYNVSWCYIKTKDYNSAITNAKESFFQSRNKHYINVSNQVLESIGFFYVLAERVEEGADFYVENVPAPGPYMIKMAKKTAEDRGYEKAFYVFNEALKNSINKKNIEEEVEIRLAQLDFFRTFKKFEKFWETTVALDEINKTHPLGEEYQIDAVEKIRSFVGYLQVRFTRNSKVNVENYNAEDLNRIIKFFDVLARLNTLETDSYRYYQGETYFAISDFKNSFLYYQKSLEHNKIKYAPKKLDPKAPKAVKAEKAPDAEALKKHKDLRVKIFDSLLASLENGNFEKEDKFSYTVYTYKNHLDIYPRDERSRIIYTKLFNLYLKNTKIDDAQNTLDRYISVYPKDRTKQQGMFTQVMDFYINGKESDKIALWIPKLKKGYLGFKPEYVEKATLILGTILFDRYQKMDTEGKKNEAAIGYLSLFQSEKYPQSIKAKSAYRASLLFLELYQTKKAFKWMNMALALFTPKERFQRKTEILAVVQNLMLSQDFESSAALAHSYLNIYCTSPFKEKYDLYRASVRYNLLSGNVKEAYQSYTLGRKCRVKKTVINEVLVGIGQYFVTNREFENFMVFHKNFKSKSWLNEFFHNSFLSMYWDFYLGGETKKMNQVAAIFKKNFNKNGGKTKAQVEMETVFAFEKLFSKLSNLNVTRLPDEKAFKEELFNKMLEKNIEALKGLTKSLAPYIKSGYPHLVTKSYQLLEKKYSSLGLKLMDYTPAGLPKEYVEGFKGAMRGLAQNLLREARGQKVTAMKLINKENILNPEVSTIMGVPEVIDQINHRHPAGLYVLPKDRLGGPL